MERRGGGEGEPQSLHPIVTPIRAPEGRSVCPSVRLSDEGRADAP